MRQSWIDCDDVTLALTRQCELVHPSRATVYARQRPKVEDETDTLLCQLIDEQYTLHPFYGSRKMVVYLGKCGHHVNRKRVQRLMRKLCLVGMAPGPNTSKTHPQHKVYPYLLRGVETSSPQPGLEHRHHLHPTRRWIRVPRRHHRLVRA